MLNKKMIGAALGATALTAGLVAATSTSAQANPNWQMWNVTSGSALTAGTTVTGSGTLKFTTEINNNLTRIECRATAGLFSQTLTAADVADIAPGATRSISVTPPARISSSTGGSTLGVCQDVTDNLYPDGVPLDVTTQNGPWTLNLTAPAAGTPGVVYTGSITGTLALPSNAIVFEDPSIGCKAQGPTGGATTSGSYNTSTNVLTANPQAFAATAISGCTIANTQLTSGTLSLSPKLSLKY
ncbi:hypothetical protein ABFU82_25090 [Nocardioides sp. WV_118_6]|uniref:hypothetical protein n=1 Tax=Nocardioides simplex TaxID=2045 RepID=UPI0021500439|nr:hypothetical protein [Pimelobacter simplex]UUW91900.1 hypothetical protein M0M43_10570 [Pimelobacter simplex]UUW95727.1 hypothetical protein M0M48_29065 [Pimelobacter simplex]